MAKAFYTVAKKLSVKQMKSLKGGEGLIGCANATGHMMVFALCETDSDCPILPLFCCGERVAGSCEENMYCTYSNFICG
jgi:hypothetical protein